MRKLDLLRMTGKNISRTRVFFTANIIAIGVGIILVVIMLSVSTAIKNYSRDLIREETSALAIEISVNPLSFGTLPLTQENLAILSNHTKISRIVPLVQGVFLDLSHQGNSKTTISLWSTIGADDPELVRLQWVAGDINTLPKKQPNYIVVPEQIVQELGVLPTANLLHSPVTLTLVRRKDGEEQKTELQLFVTAIARKTRFFRCYAPLPVLEQIKNWQNWKLDHIYILGTSTTPPPALPLRIIEPMVYESALVYLHKLEDVASMRDLLEKKGYRTASLLDAIKRYGEIASIITIILGIIGSVSLLTGSVSIFNATYASVLRRFKEIGIFKTYGATPAVILSIILSEIALTALTAGTIGYLLGKMICHVIQNTLLLNSKFNLLQTSIGLFVFVELLALGICILAGLWPALKAAKLNPIEAIRYE